MAQFQDNNIQKIRQDFAALLDANKLYFVFESKNSVYVKGVQEGKEKNLPIPCLVLCACSHCTRVLLIFNGKWLRFLSKPLELGNENKTPSRRKHLACR